MNYDQHPLIDNQSLHQFELAIEEHIAFIDYKLSGHLLFLVHTEVPAELEGKGVGSAIVVKALQFAKEHQYRIVPLCPFVKKYLEKHPEWNELISPDADRFM